MRLFLYGVATFFAFLGLLVLILPIVTTLQNLRNGLGALVLARVAMETAPLALALAVIPLCIAFAYDQMTG